MMPPTIGPVSVEATKYLKQLLRIMVFVCIVTLSCGHTICFSICIFPGIIFITFQEYISIVNMSILCLHDSVGLDPVRVITPLSGYVAG